MRVVAKSARLQRVNSNGSPPIWSNQKFAIFFHIVSDSSAIRPSQRNLKLIICASTLITFTPPWLNF